jgi:hypothetical protein
VILATKGNILGGYTPVEWESRVGGFLKADDSEKSFLFTLKNPHNVPAKTFALKTKGKPVAIDCNAEHGPCFSDIDVSNNCNANTDSSTYFFGFAYTNDTGLYGKTFFTGALFFKVKEIEIFKITE